MTRHEKIEKAIEEALSALGLEIDSPERLAGKIRNLLHDEAYNFMDDDETEKERLERALNETRIVMTNTRNLIQAQEIRLRKQLHSCLAIRRRLLEIDLEEQDEEYYDVESDGTAWLVRADGSREPAPEGWDADCALKATRIG